MNRIALLCSMLNLILAPLIAQDTTPTFPDDWLGEWEGTMTISQPGTESAKIPMSMSISTTDEEGRYEWKTNYNPGAENAVEKNYVLAELNTAKGLYLIDEQNSILMESYFVNGKLMSWYEVSQNLIFVSYELKDAQTLQMEIIAGKDRPISTTGRDTIDGAAIPEVNTFPINATQIGVLKKK